MTTSFKTIGIIPKYDAPLTEGLVSRLVEFLQQQGCQVLLDADAGYRGKAAAEAVNREHMAQVCDLAIIVGGDGTMLSVARDLGDHGVPLLGINQGRLGFLVDIAPDSMEDTLHAILHGDYTEEERSLLHAEFICEGGLTTRSNAFNEVVIHKWNVARMIELETVIDGLTVNSLLSDGLIVATPTGSTAYALSGGGPLIHPTLKDIVLVPICPHTMSQRPLVVSGSSTIEIVVTKSNTEDAQVTCDGQVNFNLMPGDRVVIRNKDRGVRLIHPRGYDYFQILRAKLHWSKKI
jgi:NAD+ kinase